MRSRHLFDWNPWRSVAVAAAMLALLGGGPARAAEATGGMVVSAQREASAVGLDILKAGGNAVDAAVAVGYALAVVDPCCGNIGGGGFMLIHRADGGETSVNFRETAPAAATPDMFLDAAGNPIREASLYGYRAVAVPGTVRGLDLALSRYGKLPRAAVIAPAIALARDGFVLGAADAAILERGAKRLAGDPQAARIFLHPDGTPYRAGERLKQPDLAATLSRIAAEGPDGFYRGPFAAAVAAAAATRGGVLSEADFSGYAASELPPLACTYRGYRVVSAPPPSSGGTVLCEILNILSGWEIGAAGYRSPRAVHLTVEAMRHAFRDRNTVLGDPDFVRNPVVRLTSAEYAAAIRAAIDPERASPSATLTPVADGERPQTTHYSVVDGAGNAVSITYTLNGNFGAAVVAPGTGVLLNNEMDDFAVKPGASNLFGLVQGEANAIAPGKRPLSSMTPTIVERDGRPVFVLGSPGGPRIITAVLETVMNLVDFGLSPEEAVAAPRFHHQYLPDTLFYERAGLPPEAVSALTGMGHKLVEQSPWGAVELIAIRPDGRLAGVNDPRRPAGAALGY
ncbi:MAG TPA: gamma-glutamyltransferase [Stellaceae bacterium]|nr:gamma-glutamyltransferase [Stellaceae bacterium]